MKALKIVVGTLAFLAVAAVVGRDAWESHTKRVKFNEELADTDRVLREVGESIACHDTVREHINAGMGKAGFKDSDFIAAAAVHRHGPCCVALEKEMNNPEYADEWDKDERRISGGRAAWPCPVCGTRQGVEVVRDLSQVPLEQFRDGRPFDDSVGGPWQVIHSHCGTGGPVHDTRAGAVDAWNRISRASLPGGD